MTIYDPILTVNESYNEEQPHYIPPELVNRFSHIDGNAVYHCYLVDLKQDFINDISPSDVILATRCELDPEVIGLMEFKMCIDRGSLTVKFNYIGTKNLGLNEVCHFVLLMGSTSSRSQFKTSSRPYLIQNIEH